MKYFSTSFSCPLHFSSIWWWILDIHMWISYHKEPLCIETAVQKNFAKRWIFWNINFSLELYRLNFFAFWICVHKLPWKFTDLTSSWSGMSSFHGLLSPQNENFLQWKPHCNKIWVYPRKMQDIEKVGEVCHRLKLKNIRGLTSTTFQLQKWLYNHQCLFICLSVSKTLLHPSSLIVDPSVCNF